MDLLSRLIAGSAATSPAKQKLNTPAERLNAYKRLCGALQQTWRNGTKLSNDNSASDQVANFLSRMNTILIDESRKAAPHSCLLHTSSAQTYIIVAKLANLTDNPAVVNAARHFFHLLINGEAEGILDSKIFARSLIDLVRRSTTIVDEEGEADLVELLFEIATKIRLDPDILPAWFYPERDQSRSRGQAVGAETRRSQFPLFYLLVEYVHHDGPLGDFARTGLLYLTDVASKSNPLEKWMIESDLAPQMASGLSALYSRLSRQVYVLTPEEKTLPIIATSDIILSGVQLDETRDEFQKNIKSFLSYLAFWQDTLNHCKSEEVRDTLLDHFQMLFVQQLLYPSLLESSDVAGGSTSAVILHLYRMLEALEHPEMARRMLRYLFAATQRKLEGQERSERRKRISISRRKSMEKLEALAEIANAPSPNLFNLLDLLTISLHSTHSQTVNASLKLISVILRRHHPHVLTNVFRLRPLADTETMQKMSEFNDVMIKLFDLSSSIAKVDSADESYQAALSDGQILLQRHSCALYRSDAVSNGEHFTYRQAISGDCRLLEAVIDLMRSFFTNDSITNITLTETLMDLASCEYILLREWLIAEGTLISVFEELVEQLKQWKLRFTEWDMLFSYQKLKIGADNNDAEHINMRSASPVSNSSSAQRANSPRPKQRPATPIRISSARSQQGGSPSAFGSIDGALARSPLLKASSPNIKALAGSPLNQASFPGEVSGAGSVSTASTAPSNASLAQLHQQVEMPSNLEEAVGVAVPKFAGLSTENSGTATPTEDSPRESASLSHVMTNAIILQEFIYEIAAMFQLRATLCDEVEVV